MSLEVTPMKSPPPIFAMFISNNYYFIIFICMHICVCMSVYFAVKTFITYLSNPAEKKNQMENLTYCKLNLM